MVYRTLFITHEEKNILKDLVFLNDSRVYKALEVFETSHTLQVIQEQFRLLLDSLSEEGNEPNQRTNEKEHFLSKTNIRIREEDETSSTTQPYWIKNNENLLIRLAHPEGKCYDVVSFSLEECIIETKSGQQYSLNPSDWKWKYSCVPHKLIQLHNQGFKIIIFTDQTHFITTQSTEAISFMELMEQIIESIHSIPINIFASVKNNLYRKPQTTSWELYQKLHKSNGECKCNFHYHVGNLAGRSGDSSSADRAFAGNMNIRFFTPPEFFLGERPQKFTLPFSPKSLLSVDPPDLHDNLDQLISEGQEMIIIVGRPSSGKTVLAKRIASKFDYKYFLFSYECGEKLTEALDDGHSVVIDGYFASTLQRQEALTFARLKEISCTCVILGVEIELAQHLGAFRNRISGGDILRYADCEYEYFESQFRMPSTAEGFERIIVFDFVPHFTDPTHAQLFAQYLI